jgi:hypothetical protein
MIGSKRSGWGIPCDVVNPEIFELEAANEMLVELYGIQIGEAEGLIQQHVVDFQVTGIKFELYTKAGRCYLS